MRILYEYNDYGNFDVFLFFTIVLFVVDFCCIQRFINERKIRTIFWTVIFVVFSAAGVAACVDLFNHPSKIVVATVDDEIAWGEMKNYKVISQKGEMWELKVNDHAGN